MIASISNQTQGWTTILRRQDGSVNFYRNWAEYKAGFGDPPNGEFFIGLDRLHELTISEPQELLIVLRTWDNQMIHAHYDLFSIADESEYYAIKVLGNYTGDAGDGMEYHVGLPFSTFDLNNAGGTRNCAVLYNGAWWFKSCYAR